MKLLKTVGYILLAIVLLFLALGAIAPKEVVTSKSIVINATPQTIHSVVNELPTWERWSPWMKQDATIKMEFSEKTAGAGAYYTWTSENSGDGQLTITDDYGPDSLYTLIDFDGQGQAHANWYFLPIEGGTKTTWSFSSLFSFPFNAFLLFQDVEGMVGKDFENGLSFLKTEVESMLPEGPALNVERIDYPATRFVGKRQVVSLADLSDHFQTVMPAVGMAVARAGVEMTGAPSGLYYNWDEEAQTTDVFIAIPVAEGVTVEGLDTVDIPPSSAVRVDYVGNYDGIKVAHEAIDAFVQANDLTVSMPVIESYLADPGPETLPNDPDKWMSQVTYLLEE